MQRYYVCQSDGLGMTERANFVIIQANTVTELVHRVMQIIIKKNWGSVEIYKLINLGVE